MSSEWSVQALILQAGCPDIKAARPMLNIASMMRGMYCPGEVLARQLTLNVILEPEMLVEVGAKAWTRWRFLAWAGACTIICLESRSIMLWSTSKKINIPNNQQFKEAYDPSGQKLMEEHVSSEWSTNASIPDTICRRHGSSPLRGNPYLFLRTCKSMWLESHSRWSIHTLTFQSVRDIAEQ